MNSAPSHIFKANLFFQGLITSLHYFKGITWLHCKQVNENLWFTVIFVTSGCIDFVANLNVLKALKIGTDRLELIW